jgi:hypothetical protein
MAAQRDSDRTQYDYPPAHEHDRRHGRVAEEREAGWLQLVELVQDRRREQGRSEQAGVQGAERR